MTNTIHFEDLTVGQRWLSPARVITEDDVTDFADLTGDHTPLHAERTNPDAVSPFGRPVAHGLLGLSILAGLSSEHPRVNTLALVSIGQWEFRHPIYFGDSVHVETEVMDVEPCGRRAGRVRWLRRLIGSRGQVLQEGMFETLVALRIPRSRAAAPVGSLAATGSLGPNGPLATSTSLGKIPAAARPPR